MLPQACWGQLQRVKETMQLDDGPTERTAQKSAGQYPREATPRATPVVWQHSPRRGATLALLWGVLGAAFLGSLLLGLFDDSGALQHVGVAASFSDQKRRELTAFLEPYRKNALVDHPWRQWAELGDEAAEAGHRMPGGQSRWSQGKDLSWEPLRPELVAEVAYEHMQGMRFRHMAHFRRWRTEKKPRECTYAQLEVVAPHELAQIFATGR